MSFGVVINPKLAVNKFVHPVELQAPGFQPIADVGVVAIGIGAELVQKRLVCAHAFEVTFIVCADISWLVPVVELQTQKIPTTTIRNSSRAVPRCCFDKLLANR